MRLHNRSQLLHIFHLASAQWILLAIFLVSMPVQAITLENHSGASSLMHAISIYADPSGQQTFEEVRRLPPQAFEIPENSTDNALNLAFTKDSYWIKFSLQRAPDAPSEWILQIPYLGIDEIDFYAPGRAPVITGAARDTQSRALFNRYFVFPVEVSTSPEEYYLRVKSSYAITIALEAYERRDFAEETQKTLIAQFLYFGGVLALILYNLQLYVSLRDRVYLHYFLFGLFMGLAIFAGNGFGRILLWPDWPRWDLVSLSVLISISGGFSVLFCRSFLQTQRLLPRQDIALRLLASAYFFVSGGLLYATLVRSELDTWYKMLMVLTPAYFGLITLAAIRVLRQGHESAKYFLLAWVFLCVGVVVATMRTMDWLQTNTLTFYAIQISSGFDMLFLSYALAYRIQSERQRREKAQQETLDAKHKMVEVLRTSEERLELEVAERTAQLKSSLANEKKLHEQYVRFGAMISHEFRNPLNNIESQTDLLRREKKSGIDHFEKRIRVISSAVNQLALLFDRWLQTDRLNNELSLRHVQPMDINAWMQQLINRYEPAALHHRIYFEPHSENPIAPADESLLQIALINLLDNACKYSAPNTVIIARTLKDNTRVGIEVADEGEGIDPSLHELIFEERFRVSHNHTNRGTGLGLAFVKRIAELHYGYVTVQSKLGNGSTFTIWIGL